MADRLWDELVAIRSCLLPDEFRWRGTSDEQHAWECAYQEYQATWVAPAIQQVHVALRVSRALGVSLYARLDAREALPTITVMVECPELVSHAAMTVMVQARLAECETQAIPHPTFDVLMLLQEALSEQQSACSTAPHTSVHETPTAYAPSCDMKRVLFWTHHLVAPSKRKQFAAWCPDMHVWGILKLGYPGFLCFEGAAEDVDDMACSGMPCPYAPKHRGRTLGPIRP
ncbi:hypothetical protein MNAN1_002284 [Malassezia nana]|uniref:Uncharacterized protein n=1 Tax=Malassezia nana TaxID=180528 RepID=A0AAF0EMT5_9BASI|nr:hypothetical protein MNAN1_002284 [Malassezia nana]